ncbi:GHKL domain-containing protein [Rhodocytophaga rosea]|uniref:histidine kinase n=1 Tax=Rhodocytophaga rosea TaxID=2704465 RepID=A0A6C0GP29_9BACT|nr:sensor histidine kinase [Rhodocytophaga rosea]QHT69687.1 GHKL domain-containing protein [Rhodocytophaga rosea]
MKASFLNFWLIILCLTAACRSNDSFQKPPIAIKGILDLRTWDFARQGSLTLDGEWEFYWKKLYTPVDFLQAHTDSVHWVQVPKSWNAYQLNNKDITGEGFATYRLRMVLNKPSSGNFSIRVPLTYTASRMWVNGRLMYESGTVSEEYSTTLPQYKPEIIDFIPDQEQVELVIQVSNFHYSDGGLRQPIQVGLESDIRDRRLKAIAAEFWLEGSILIMAFYHLGLFLIRKRDLSTLWFSIFCMLVALRIFITGEYTINLFFGPNWWFLIRVEYLTFFLGTAAFTLFLYTVFEAVFSKQVVRVVCGVVALFTLMVLFSSPIFFSSMLIHFQLFTVLIAIYGFYVIIGACVFHLEGSYAFLLGYLVFIATFFNDLLYSHKIVHTGYYISLGLFVFIFSQAFLLTRRFSIAFAELEKANQKLSEANILTKEQNENLWQLNAELDSFVYRTSHDLRAPIASVMGLINIAKQENDLTQIRYYLSLKEKSLKKLDGVIRDIIDYSKNKSLDLEITPIDFETQVAEVFANHDYMENAGRIHKSIESMGQDVFYSDSRRIDIILNNLISNAIRYFNPYQEQPFIKIKVTTDAKKAQIEVSDNGLGIAKEYQNKIFDMFFRVSNHGGGSGMGLYVVKETIYKLGGEIAIESEANKGTIFRVTLPNVKPPDSIS